MNKFNKTLISFGFAAVASLCPGHPGEHGDALRHWETPSRDPDRIVLTWSEDSATTQSVTWRTSDEVDSAFAEIALADPSARFDLAAERVEAETESLEIGASNLNGSRTDRYHSVTFRGLDSDTLHAYRVGDGEEHWSEWIHFRSAAAEPKPLKFLYFGDAQNNVLSHWSRVVRAAYQKVPQADFSIHAGDLVNRAHRDREWAEWFKAGGWIHASVPSILVSGNHEYDRLDRERQEEERRVSLQWRPQFALPVVEELPEELRETVYAIRIQGILVVALNSNRELEAQAEWLDKVLEADDSAWRILTFHHPIFSSGKGRDNEAGRRLWKPVFDKHAVDLVLQGHDHTYARGHVPTRMSDAEAEGPTTMYVNSVSGPKMYEFKEDGWNVYQPDGVELDRKAENTQFFQVIDIDRSLLRYRAYMADGTLYDWFTLAKDENGAKRLSEETDSLGEERRYGNSLPYSRDGF